MARLERMAEGRSFGLSAARAPVGTCAGLFARAAESVADEAAPGDLPA